MVIFMQVKVRKQNKDGEMRLETKGAVREIRIKEDFLHARREIVELCFQGVNTSDIISMPLKEFQNLAKEVSMRSNLVKSVRIIKEEV